MYIIHTAWEHSDRDDVTKYPVILAATIITAVSDIIPLLASETVIYNDSPATDYITGESQPFGTVCRGLWMKVSNVCV
jgi:hypothetical protein